MALTYQFDIVIRNGSIADGRGSPLETADVAVKDGRIVEVGRVVGRGAREIDARGYVVTPGFVDIHTHYDGQASWENTLQPSSWHGVTTVVMGNCGVGFAPVRAGDHDALIELMEGVEDIPGTALHEGIDWQWESFSEYLDILAGRTFDVDVCAQLPHGPLRLYVMGERAMRKEPATPEDSARMRVLAREAMEAGAIGFSTSRSLAHKTVKGEVTPSYLADEAELMAIAQGLKDAGRGVLQWVSDWHDQDAEMEMILRIVRTSGRPLSISVGQSHAFNQDWRKILASITTATAEGLEIRAQVAPRPIGIIFGLATTRTPLHTAASMRAIAGKPLAEKVAIMRGPEFRQKVLAEVESTPAPPAIFNPSRMFPIDGVPDYGQDPNRSVAAIASREGRSANDVIYDLLLEQNGEGLLFCAAMNYLDHNYDALAEMFAHPGTVLGLSDGGAHVGMIADGSFPTTALTYWGRDAAHGKEGALVEAIRRQTSATAETVGLRDRGVIAPGMKADLNIIDVAALEVGPLRVSHDLPAGAMRLLQGAKGYIATIVSGVVTYRDGVATGDLPGRLVRGPQHAGAPARAEAAH
jgi:N-acyl-D-aspartate/D-glutamate deacylase